MSIKNSKPFVTYEKQIYNLIHKKKLIIGDLQYAILKLQDIGYYSLIDGYKSLFYNATTCIYESGTCFEDIVALYEFDANLRHLIFKYICIIEQKIRSLISYTFCEKYSENQNAYITPGNYNYIKKNQQGINRLINMLIYEANNNTEHAYVVYQRNTYGNVPLWVIMKTLSAAYGNRL